MRDVTSREAELEQALRWALRDIIDLCHDPDCVTFEKYTDENHSWLNACALAGLDPATGSPIKSRPETE